MIIRIYISILIFVIIGLSGCNSTSPVHGPPSDSTSAGDIDGMASVGDSDGPHLDGSSQSNSKELGELLGEESHAEEVGTLSHGVGATPKDLAKLNAIKKAEAFNKLSYEDDLLSSPVAVRKFLLSSESEDRSHPVMAYILFTSKPTNDEAKKRYLEIAAAFNSVLSASGAIPNKPASFKMPTYWLLKDTIPDHLLSENIPHRAMVKYYDYDRAKQYLSLMRSYGAKVNIDSQGPILLGWGVLPDGSIRKSNALVCDLSTYEGLALVRAIRVWEGRITMNQEIWNEGYAMHKFKEEVRNMCINHGTDIVDKVMESLYFFIPDLNKD